MFKKYTLTWVNLCIQLTSLQFNMGDPFHGQLTAVKTRYPLTSIAWPYCGLKCRINRFLFLFIYQRRLVKSSPNFQLTMHLNFRWKLAGLGLRFSQFLLLFYEAKPFFEVRFMWRTGWDLRLLSFTRIYLYNDRKDFGKSF